MRESEQDKQSDNSPERIAEKKQNADTNPLETSNISRLKTGRSVVFRGSFNPIHEGHIGVVKELLARDYKTVIISPVSWSPGKGQIETSKELRSEMILKVLKAEGLPIADSFKDAGVYVVSSRNDSRRVLGKSLQSHKCDFALGADNDHTYSKHRRYKLGKALGGSRLAIIESQSQVHSSDIRKGTALAHPAIREIIAQNDLYIADRQQSQTLGLDRFQNVSILYNPISGSGKAQQSAEKFAAELQSRGISTKLTASKAQYAPGELEQIFSGQDLAIVFGGDGTLMGSLGALSALQIPVYMAPQGNESLFSKLFDMKGEFSDVISDLETRETSPHYFGLAQDKPFFLMLSMGLDAKVLEAIGERSGPSSNWMYVKAGLKVLPRYKTPIISLKVDGVPVIEKERGYLIIGNTNSYSRDLNLLPEANSSAAELCLRFFPQKGIGSELTKAMRMAFKKSANLKGSQFFSGRKIELQVHNGPYPLQADGELFGSIDQQPLKLECSKHAIRVLGQD